MIAEAKIAKLYAIPEHEAVLAMRTMQGREDPSISWKDEVEYGRDLQFECRGDSNPSSSSSSS